MWAFSGTKAPEVGATWYYNWGSKPSGSPTTFVPMIWGERDNNSAAYRAAKDAPSANLLGFNEPDGCGGDEAACLSSDRALQLWPKLIATGKRLGSPAVARDYNWLKRFMDGAKSRGYKVDFIAVHTYQDLSNPDRAAQETLKLVDWIHSQYNLPVWLTEFGALWDTDPRNIKAYMEKTLWQLNARPYVERYAWFSDHTYRGNSSSALWNDNGNVSQVGWAYKNAPLEEFLEPF